MKNSIKAKILSTSINEKLLDEGAVEVSCFIAFTINNINCHSILTGIDYGNRSAVAQLAAFMTKRLFISFEHENDDSWAHFLLDMYTKLLEGSGSQNLLVFLNAAQLTCSQWYDVISIMKFGMPSRSHEKIQKLNFKKDFDLFNRRKIKFCISFSNLRFQYHQHLLKYKSGVSHCLLHEVQPLNEHALKDYLMESVLSLDVISQSLPISQIASLLYWIVNDLPQFQKTDFFHEDFLLYIPADTIKVAIQIFSEQYTEKARYIQDTITRCNLAASITA